MFAVHVSSPQEPIAKYTMARHAFTRIRRFLLVWMTLGTMTTVTVRSIKPSFAPRTRESPLTLGATPFGPLKMDGQTASTTKVIAANVALKKGNRMTHGFYSCCCSCFNISALALAAKALIPFQNGDSCNPKGKLG